MHDWNASLMRWADAGLIDGDTVQQIRDYEAAEGRGAGLRWPIRIALGFGGLMVAGGVLLFVAAHWDALSPGQRLTLVLLLVGAFHTAGAVAAGRFAGLSVALHAVGTAALGGGIALAGQVFDLAEHWPRGMLLWAIGAGAGWLLLRQIPQLVMLAVLTPAWLVGEWSIGVGHQFHRAAPPVAACGLFLCALGYLAATRGPADSSGRRALQWTGAIGFGPAAVLLALVSTRGWWTDVATFPMPMHRYVLAWVVAVALPLALAIGLRRREAWPHAVAAAWTLTLGVLGPGPGTWALYPWWALGAIGLVAWGVRDGRPERVNLGATVFATAVIAFYFSQVFDKLGRSAGLVAFGILFLAGAWTLERTRRRLIEAVSTS